MKIRCFVAAAFSAVFLLLLPALAHAQGAIQQMGPASPGQIPMYVDRTHVLATGGTSLGQPPVPSANAGTLPNGVAAVNPNIAYSAFSGYASAAYSFFDWGFDGSGNAVINIGKIGGGIVNSCTLIFNGTGYPCAGGGGNVTGPSTTVIGDISAWGDTFGHLLSDPATGHLGADGLNIGVGVAVGANTTGYAMEVQKLGSVTDPSHASAAAFFHNIWNGSDIDANVYGGYGDIWYTGLAGNQAMGLKGNAYAYAASGTPSGSLPNQGFAAPNIGTLNYMAGVYGRSADYLPGTITYAAAIMADGLYNIAPGATVSNSAGVLLIPPYVAASADYGILIPAAGCSPNCFYATIRAMNDPVTFATKNGLDLAVLDPGATVVNHVSIYGSAAGIGPTIRSDGTDTNINLLLEAKGAASVVLRSSGVNVATFAAAPTGVNNLTVSGANAGNPVEISVAGGDTNIAMELLTKGTGSVEIGTGNGWGLLVSDPSGAAVNHVAVYGGQSGVGPTIRSEGSDTNPNLILGAKGIGSVVLQSNSLNSATFLAPASAINNFSFSGSSAGNTLSMAAVGGDTDIGIALNAKGSGSILLQSSGNNSATFLSGPSAVNGLAVSGSATGQAVVISVAGTDTDIDLELVGKGNGRIVAGSNMVIDTIYADQAVIGFRDTGTVKWQMGRQTASDDFFLHDVANAVNAIFVSVATGNTTIGETGKLVSVPNLVVTQASPAAADACTAGQLVADTGFIYACTASGAWKRAPITGGY